MKFYIKLFLCGSFTSLIFPPFFLTPLGFIIFPFLIYLINTNKNLLSYKSFFLGGFLYGLGFFSIFLIWLREPFLLDQNSAKYAFFSFTLIIYCALYFGFIFCLIYFFKNEILKIFMFPAIFVLAEFICINLFYGFPWFSFALINSNNIIGTTLVFYFGSLGLSYLTILIFLFPYIFLIENLRNKIKLYFFYIILFVSIILLILIRINANDEKISLLSASIIQLNYPLNQHITLEKKNDKLKDITNIITNSKSDLIIFGENDFPFLMDLFSIKNIQNHLKNNQKMIIGTTRTEYFKYYNSLFLIEKNDYQIFDKKILVPFGEFIPLRSYFTFMEYIAGTVDFSIGKKNRYIKLNDNFSILPVICYEILYFWNLINKNDTNIIVNLTNDSWFGSFSGPYQHFYFTKLRAAELNKSIIRVSNSGISASIDNKGSILSFIRLNDKGIDDININQNNVLNNFLTFHKIFFLLIMFALSIGLFINIRDDKR